MQIKLKDKSSHLTAIEVKAIKAIINAGLTSGKVGRKIYRIHSHENDYKVVIQENRTNDYGQPYEFFHSAIFSVIK